MQRILITGALGQLGRSLCLELCKDPNNFILATDIATTSEKFSFSLHQADVCDYDHLLSLVEKHDINVIYHLVAILSAKGEQAPLKTWEINMNGFLNIMQIGVLKKKIKIFWPSSIAVFGSGTPLINTPQNVYNNPRTMYGVTKSTCERLMEYYRINYDLDIRSLRFPGIISLDTVPGGGTTDYIIELLLAARDNSSYSCFLSAETTLPMLHIKDAIRSILELMKVNEKALKINTSYNITGFSVSPEQVLKALNKRGIDFHMDYSPDFRQKIADSWPSSIDDTAAKNDWGWEVFYNLERTLDEALEGFV